MDVGQVAAVISQHRWSPMDGGCVRGTCNWRVDSLGGGIDYKNERAAHDVHVAEEIERVTSGAGDD